MLADEATHLVLLDDGHILKVLTHDGPDVALLPRYPTSFCDLFQQFFSLIHDSLPMTASVSRFVQGMVDDTPTPGICPIYANTGWGYSLIM